MADPKFNLSIPNSLTPHRLGLFLFLSFIVYGLAIFQDYVYSRVQLTGFYLSESMLFNIYWILFIPFLYGATLFYEKINPSSLVHKVLYFSCTGFLFSILHIFIFTGIFISLSHLFYPTPHRFLRILGSAFSNQLFITIIVYVCVPIISKYLKKPKESIAQTPQSYLSTLTVKQGTKTILIDVKNIQSIETDRPYTAIQTLDQRFLHDKSLKKLQDVLDPEIFVRVHRSSIINRQFITQLDSRKNGDYDATLANGQLIRLSRHYRSSWETLVHHSA